MKFFRPSRYILISILLLSAFELFLRFADYPGSEQFQDPFIGFSSLYPLFEKSVSKNGEVVFETSSKKKRFFNKQVFPGIKKHGEIRIFCFGGSTVYGRPFSSDTAFPRFLQEALSMADRGKTFNVINAGGISYASYRIVHLLSEAVSYKPDLFIVYSGHNEFLENRTYGNLKNLSPFRIKAQYFFNRLYLYRLIKMPVLFLKKSLGIGITGIDVKKEVLPSEVDPILDMKEGIEIYTEDFSTSDEIYKHFRFNLERMADIAYNAGIPIIFMTLPSNVKDLSPFKSEPAVSLPLEKRKEIKDYFNNARYFLKKGDAALAVEEADKGLSMDPRFADLHFIKGRAFLEMNKPDKAEKELTKAKDTDMVPLRATTRINHIIKETAENKKTLFLDIESVFKKETGTGLLGDNLFLDHCHPTTKGHMIIAKSLFSLIRSEKIFGDLSYLSSDKINHAFSDIVSSMPESYFADGIANVGRVLNWAKKYAESVKRLKGAVEVYPDSPQIHRFLGHAYMGSGDYNRALEEYKIAVELDHKIIDVRERMAEIYYKQGKYKAVVGILKDVIQSSSSSFSSRFNLALAYTKLGRLGLAENEYKMAIAIEPDNAKLYSNLGDIYLQQGKDAQAMEMYKKAVKKDKGQLNAYLRRGMYYMKQGDINSAKKEFNSILSINHDHSESIKMMAQIYVKEERYDDAEKYYKKLTAIERDSPFVYKDLGIFYAKRGRLEEGLRYLNRASLLLEKDELDVRIPNANSKELSFHLKDFSVLKAEIYNSIANIYSLQKRYEKALSFYKKAKKISPSFPNIRYNIGLTYFLLNRWNEAIDEFLYEYEKNGMATDTDLLYYLAISYGNIGYTEKSISFLKRVISINPEHAQAYKDLGILYLYRMKDKKRGKEYLERSLLISPDQPEAENIRKTLKEDLERYK